ncbi:MAG: ROK family protein [Anaerorhabdus sp.]
MKYYLGLDIGGTSLKIGYLDDSYNILFQDIYDVAFDNYDTPIIKTVKKSIKHFIDVNEIDVRTLSFVGVSATGQIDTNKGVVIGVGNNIKNWLNTNIKNEIESLLSIPTYVMNDANCMVVAEKYMGGAKGYDNVIGITIGTGVGGGIITQGNLLLGSVGIAAEIGHMSINFDGLQCGCKNKGCFEKYASMTALIKMVKECYPDKSIDFNGILIFKMAACNDEIILDCINKWISYIAFGIVNLVHIFNPEVVVIGGGVSNQKELFLDPLNTMVKERIMYNYAKDIKIKAATLKNNAGLIGAVAFGKELKK